MPNTPEGAAGRAAETPKSRRLAEFIRERQAEILVAWEAAVRQLPIARDLRHPVLIDHVPELLNSIAEIADQLAVGGTPAVPTEIAERHAVERLGEGFDLGQVITEFALLRDCVLVLWERDQLALGHLADLRVLNQAIDRAVSESVNRFTLARDRALQALDRLANAALESRSLDDLLKRLLQVLLETVPAIETATILLREGDRLRVRASVGLEQEVADGFTIPIGEGFAGSIAAEGRAKFLKAASSDPLVKSPVIRSKGVRALYGVPLIDTGRCIGVAHVGSLTAEQFSDQDKRIVSTMASRATTAIHQHVLQEQLRASDARYREVEQERVRLLEAERSARGDAERSLAVVDALLSSSLVGLGLLDTEFRYVRVNDALARINGSSVAQHVGHTVSEVLGTAADFVMPTLRLVLDTGEPAANVELTAVVPWTPNEQRSFLASFFPVRTAGGDTLGVGAAVVEVTELQRTQQALRRSEQLFRATFDAAAVGIALVALDGTFLRFNKRFPEIVGYPPEELHQLTFQDITHPNDLAADLAYAQRLRDGEIDSYTIEKRYVHKQGHTIWVQLSGSILRTDAGEPIHYIAVIDDISDRKGAEEALRRSEERLQRAISIDTVGVLFFNLDGRMLDANRALERMSGYSVDELRRVDWHQLTALDFTDSTARAAKELATIGKTAPYEKQWIRRDGSRWWGLFAPTRLANDDRDFTCVEFIIDITERKRAETQLRERARFEEQLIGIVSHDLRTPLTAVRLGAAALLRNEKLGERPTRALLRIQSSAERAVRLVNDLLDFTQARLTGTIPVNPQPLDFHALTRTALSEIEANYPDRSIAFECGGDGHGIWDGDRISQVISNLVSNALKYSPPDTPVSVRTRGDGASVTLEVHNVGTPIQPDAIAHLFEPMQRASSQADRAGRSVGLGLYIVKHIVNAHAGSIEVRSNDLDGTTFMVRLPRVRPSG